MGKTFAEKILSRKAGGSVHAGETVIVDVDAVMTHDTTGPLAIKAFQDMGGVRFKKPESTVIVLDHAIPCPNEKIAGLHQLLRNTAKEQNCVFYDQNAGICHQIMVERGHVKEGYVVAGADSHTCSYGCVGAFAVGVGSTDLGAILLTGKTWLRVPESVKIVLNGKLPQGVYAKDVVLTLLRDLTADGATYQCMEFHGDTFAAMSWEESFTICNMAIEMGAKTGVFVSALKDPELIPDEDASYSMVREYRAETLEPPHGGQRGRPSGEGGAPRGSGVHRQLHQRAAGGPADRGEHPQRPETGAGGAYDRFPRFRTGVPPGGGGGHRHRPFGGGRHLLPLRMRPVCGHPGRRARQRGDGDLHHRPQLPGPDGQPQRVYLLGLAGQRGRGGSYGTDHGSAGGDLT